MKFQSLLRVAVIVASFVMAAQSISVTPASAITLELAKKCRELSLKAFPRAKVGTKSDNAGEARKYYNGCVANGGTPPDDAAKKPAAAPVR